jgi:hypothetical protein
VERAEDRHGNVTALHNHKIWSAFFIENIPRPGVANEPSASIIVTVLAANLSVKLPISLIMPRSRRIPPLVVLLSIHIMALTIRYAFEFFGSGSSHLVKYCQSSLHISVFDNLPDPSRLLKPWGWLLASLIPLQRAAFCAARESKASCSIESDWADGCGVIPGSQNVQIVASRKSKVRIV